MARVDSRPFITGILMSIAMISVCKQHEECALPAGGRPHLPIKIILKVSGFSLNNSKASRPFVADPDANLFFFAKVSRS